MTLFHHPFSRAATVLWMLEELDVPYTVEHVDIMTGANKSPEFLALNTMGKLPTLVDGETIVTETAAIGMYLADRYSSGTLAPALDDPARGTYLRWICYGPSVIEPCAYARASQWDYKPASAGWGTWESMHETVEAAIGDGPYLLGDRFTMADVCFGATVRFMMQFNMIEKRPAFEAYVARLNERPANRKAEAINHASIEAHGLGK